MSSHVKMSLTTYYKKDYEPIGHLVYGTNKPKQTQFSTYTLGGTLNPGAPGLPMANGAHKMYFLCKTNPISRNHK